jgi:hypothetical protein
MPVLEPWRLKVVLNAVNGSTLLGLGVAKLGCAQVSSGRRGLLLATEFRLGFPKAAAFTVGNVVLCRHDIGWLEARPRLLVHEERHTWQYVACVGLPMIPMYLLAAGYSYLRGGDPVAHNTFERLAGLEDGGYPRVSARERRRRARDVRAG